MAVVASKTVRVDAVVRALEGNYKTIRDQGWEAVQANKKRKARDLACTLDGISLCISVTKLVAREDAAVRRVAARKKGKARRD